MASRAGYGQFCPVAKACEVVTERWTPLIILQMYCGCERFGEIHRGVPLMSRSLLSKRLQELERAGVVERFESGGSHELYRLTQAGQELGPIVLQLGKWGKQWTKNEYTTRELDAGLLMYDMQRRVEFQSLPENQVVINFLYHDAPLNRRRWWLILNQKDAALCVTDPGTEADLQISTNIRVMTDIWMGDLSYRAALETGDLSVVGPPELRNLFPSWFRLSYYANVDRKI